MSRYATTLAVYLLAATGLWITTRWSENRYIRWQWRRPRWILLRLMVLVACFHGLFTLVGVHPGIGFGMTGLVALAALSSFSGAPGMGVIAVGFAMHEWIFWLPSRRELVLRQPRSTPAMRVWQPLVGRPGTVTSDLKPTGTVEIDGSEHPARSEGGFMEQGEAVVVASEADFEIVVRRAPAPITPSCGGRSSPSPTLPAPG